MPKVNPATYNWLQRAQATNALAKRKGHTGKVTAEGVKSAWIRSGGLCHWCKNPINLGPRRKAKTLLLATIEHVIPLSLGGTNTDNNIEFACKECNQERS